MKKIAIVLLSVFGFIGLTACNLGATEQEILATNEDIYLFSALSSTSLLPSGNQQVALAYQLADKEQTIVETKIEDINKYLEMMEMFLGQNNGLSTESVESDRPEYQNQIIFTTVDLSGKQIVHTLYYNEVLLTEENDVDDLSEKITDKTKNKEDLEDEKDNDEFEDQETKITGLLVMNNVEYVVNGKKEIEENETKIKMTSYLDEQNYVTVVSKVEENERKYSYEVVTDGVMTMQSKVKFEEEDGKTKFVLNYVSADISGSFSFKREMDDDKDIIKIKYEVTQGGVTESGEVKILVIIDPITQDTTYQFVIKAEGHQEKSIEHEREDEHDEDENDDVVDTTLIL